MNVNLILTCFRASDNTETNFVLCFNTNFALQGKLEKKCNKFPDSVSVYFFLTLR